MAEIVSLFKHPYCTFCFEELHDDHYGWDICSVCMVMEAQAPKFDLQNWKLDGGKHFLACPCYGPIAEQVYALVSKAGNLPSSNLGGATIKEENA